MRNVLNYNMSASPISLNSAGERFYIPPPKGTYKLKSITLKIQSINGATTWAAQLNKYNKNGVLLASNVLVSNITLPSGAAAGTTVTYKFATKNVVKGNRILYYGFTNPVHSVCNNDEYYVLNVVTEATTLTADVTVCLEVL